MKHRPFDLLVFDLGGVLVVDSLLAWMSTEPSPEEIWRTWLTSPIVRALESGTLSASQFAEDLIVELSLSVSTEHLLADFTLWVKQLYAGALELLNQLSQSYTLASLSNTNVIHWHRCCHDMQLGKVFDHNFPSHETGLLKPDQEAFQNVIDQTGCLPERIVFLDDNQLNVDSATNAGMVVVKTVGITGVRDTLRDLGIV